MSVSNHVQYISTAAHGHQSNYQGQTAVLRHEDDVEKRIQARIAKDGIRIKEFFIDFDKLRKGTVGEAAVSTLHTLTVLLLEITLFTTFCLVCSQFRTCIGTLGVNLTE